MSATFPTIVEQKRRRFVRRRDAEKYKHELAGLPFQDEATAPEVLVPLRVFAGELGLCVRTLGRRIAESRAGGEQAEFERRGAAA
jgi:hypothetical protein